MHASTFSAARQRLGTCAVVLFLFLGFGCASSERDAKEDSPNASGKMTESQIREAILKKNRGLAFLEQDKPGKAVPEFEQVVKLVPEDPLGYVNLAIAHLRRQEPDEAKRWASKAIEVAPDDAAGATVLALIHEWVGELEEAAQARARSLEKNPDDLRVRYAQARYLLRKEEESSRQAGIQDLQLLLEVAPGNVVVLSDLALALLEEKRGEEAAVALEQLVETAGWEAEANEPLTEAEESIRASEFETAIRNLRIGTNLLRGREIFRLSSEQVRSGVQGFPIEAFRVRELAKHQAPQPPPTRVTFQARADLPASFAFETVLGSDGGHAVAVDLHHRGRIDWVEAKGTALHLPEGVVLRQPREISSVLAADTDHDGDLDLMTTSHDGSLQLWRNDGPENWINTTARAGLMEIVLSLDATAGDLDGDTDLDIVVSKPVLTILWNQRLGQFESRPSSLLATSVIAEDLTGDGCIDLAITGAWGKGVYLLPNDCHGGFVDPVTISGATADRLVAFDHDNDGLLDLLLTGVGDIVEQPGRLQLLRGLGNAKFEDVSDRLPEEARADAAVPADVDGDGDLDLVLTDKHAVSPNSWLENTGGNDLGWLQVELEAASESSAKVNTDGIGSRLEIWVEDRHQVRTVRRSRTHFGLGNREKPDLMRVLWTNGVPQSRLEPEANTVVTEKEILKGSCPFLYVWDGERYAFGTDLLWASPLGLPLPVPVGPHAPIVHAGWDHRELVRIELRHTDSAPVLLDGAYDMRLTEELWETAYFDLVRLHVLDHPESLQPYSNLKIQPPPYPTDEIRWVSNEVPPLEVVDGLGASVLSILEHEDAEFLLGGEATSFQGIRTPHELVIVPPSSRSDLLLMTGWIFPTDASLNVGLARRKDLSVQPPRIEFESGPGVWTPLPDLSAYPPGKTKTIVLDLPEQARGKRLRIRTNLDIRWDRVAFGRSEMPDGVLVRELSPEIAELRYRGFSAPWRESAEGPHLFRYEEASAQQAWPAIDGPYTRFGDVRPLLEKADDRLLVMGPGDEVELRFEATGLPPVPRGWRRTLFLESHGWDKDADLNTLTGDRVEPLPCRGMREYPSRECPTEERIDYLLEYQNRPGPRGIGR